MKNSNALSNILKILYFFLCLTLYFVAVEIFQPLKIVAILLFVIGFIVILIFTQKRFYYNTSLSLWIISIFPFIISLFYSPNFFASLQFILIYSASVMGMFLIINSHTMIQKFSFKMHFYMSITIMIFTIISYLFPRIFELIIMPALNDRAKSAYSYFYNLGDLSGISGQTGTNAFLLSVGLSFLLFRKKNFINVFLILLFAFSIVMSEKRGILLANGVALVFVILVFTRMNYKKLLVLILSITPLLIFIWSILVNFNKIDFNEFSSGRIYLSREAINIFKENFLMGTGINSYSTVMANRSITFGEGLNAHNIYVQLLSEVGLMGFGFFMIAQIYTLIFTMQIKNSIEVKEIEEGNFIYTVIYFQVFFIVYSFIGNPLYDYNFFYIYLLLIAPVYKMKHWR